MSAYELLQKMFSYIGYFAPNYLFFLSIFLLLPNRMATIMLIVGYAANLALNSGLKIWVQELRPSQKQHSFAFDLSDVYVQASELGVHEYGMPSGHSQAVWFLTTYTAMAMKNNYITALYASLSICTMIQRVKYKNHTIQQVFAGMIVGVLFAYGLYRTVLII